MASKQWFPIDIPMNITMIFTIIVIIGVLWLMTRPKQYSPMNVQVGPNGQPGNPTGKQALDFRSQAQEQYPYQEPGANTIPSGNAWI